MRSEKINPLFSPISSLSGIGPKLEVLFNRLVGPKLIHLLLHIPYNVIKRNRHENIHQALINSIVTLKVKILEHKPSRFKKQPYKVNCMCGEVPIDIVFFYARHPVIKTTLPVESERFISGKLEYFRNTFQITHPSHIIEVEKINELKEIEPIYGLTAGLSQRILLKNMQKILLLIPELEEWIENKIIKKYSFKSWKNSLLSIHNPKSSDDLIYSNVHRRRLAFDELLSHQLAIAIIRNYNQKQKGIEFKSSSLLVDNFIELLPFKLTNSQKNVWKEIKEDLTSSHQMVRLLQGDVGSGKTIIALLTILQAIESGFQTAMMVPTSILAFQHFNNVQILFKKLDIKIIILTGKDKGNSRLEKLKKIKSGEAKLVIGTHALIQDDVTFNSIGLVVIDEQHRFGVFQRMAFTNKGRKPSILVMSATPIPRTLALAAYGDMDESKITEKPIGRLPIKTTSLSILREKKLIERLLIKLQSNEKTYWVCPLIEESEELDLKAAKDRYENLNKIFNKKVLIIHGQLKEKEKEEVMHKFQNEDYKILVSTTVIEVGIDIKEATTIIIEHAERFGLAQLHQLRGRVGRNDIQSSCILLHKDQIGENAKKRIIKMKETNDGFEIAKKDLEIRGPGEVLGRKQSGLPSFQIADLSFDGDLLEDVRKYVDLIFQNDPKLETNEGMNLKNLLYLFERDVAIKTLQAG
jgi:ATP-dependent DNA helicase RecG